MYFLEDSSLYISSSFSTPTFFTFGFQILSGIQAGAPLGFATWTLMPSNMCTFFVPRSRSLMSVMPRLAAFKAACLGCFPVKTPISFPLLSLRAKFLVSVMFSLHFLAYLNTCIIVILNAIILILSIWRDGIFCTCQDIS